ncbi:DUF3027 domain-containing protein [Micrococcus porci]|uniref:DUF3027 domain-containing protein n=1 Tax=Micrococcus TaxID=1269 RepID=UPI001CCD480C|nr:MULTISPECIES: DUF3027 domain-containing protein [Micrococcus]MCG7422239.1 DUF3027 domain-containing protein [Micrococcus sp. ACRRV]UBH24609.1 DUF3027 domain-containing protein [Micrococcus porci]
MTEHSDTPGQTDTSGQTHTPEQAPAVAPAGPAADAAPAASARAPRRRAPKRDELLAAAVDEARAALTELAEEGQVGPHLGVTVDDDRLMTHRFAAEVPGYTGWVWYSTIARAPRAKKVTVCETGLEAGEGAVVAPAWVPYADRVSAEERERLAAVAEGRVPDAG